MQRMTAEAAKRIVEDLNLTQDEVQRLASAFEKPEFRKLFQEYAEEISDPENCRKLVVNL